jgi:RNA polymerase sigma factor (TIGR02999 family)
MAMTDAGEVTRLLLRWKEGDEAALERLTPLVYGELKRLAHSYMRGDREEPLLQTTALVHEAYLRLTGMEVDWEGRSQFVAVAATLMRRILVDFARRRKAEKRGGGDRDLTLEEHPLAPSGEVSAEDSTLALHEALKDLEKLDPRKHQAVEMKYFGGATVAEISRVLKLAPRTVERDLRLGRAWLARYLAPPSGAPPGSEPETGPP